ncbi:cell division protein FtsB [Natronospira proteinivora]|uniref:Cell division protein FtsB n=1 Tax=Natronospira proteinivora TaxID=1807133 RepID=A0ABT1G5R9_9GAMM|nr:cell division protein FtsB [Natronospira proteinivora]MCP1726639.1 cell division protein FtsB [Natronospira proteinivora]
MRTLLAILLLILIVLQVQLWTGRGGLPEIWELRQQIEAQEEENQALRTRNEALEAEVENLREGSAAIEERARSELGLVREGEVFYEVIELDRPLREAEEAFEEGQEPEDG